MLDACHALGKACGFVGDFYDGRRYLKRAKEGYEEQVRNCEDFIEEIRDLVKRCESALGEENIVTLLMLSDFGGDLKECGEYEEAREVHERCLAGRMKLFGEKQPDTLGTLNDLGIVYDKGLKNYEKALECYERALKEYEKMSGKNHPRTLGTVKNIAIVYENGLKDYGKAEELYQRALEGFEAQLGKDHEDMMRCAENYRNCLILSGNSAGLAELKKSHPNVESYDI